MDGQTELRWLRRAIPVPAVARKIVNERFFPSHNAHRAVLICLFYPEPDTSLHCETTDTGLMHRAMCLFASLFSPLLVAPTLGGMARLS